MEFVNNFHNLLDFTTLHKCSTSKKKRNKWSNVRLTTDFMIMKMVGPVEKIEHASPSIEKKLAMTDFKIVTLSDLFVRRSLAWSWYLKAKTKRTKTILGTKKASKRIKAEIGIASRSVQA